MNESLNEKLTNQKSEIEELQKTAHLQFETIANKLLEEKSSKFTETNKSNIESLLNPLKEDINKFKTKVEETYDKESKQRFSQVILPDERTIIIDSKVSLIAYDKFTATDDPDEQKIFMSEHISATTSHINQLSAKRYDNLNTSLDFTMMFIPVEPAYLLAIQGGSDLWAYAYTKRILLVSPTTLIACLKLFSDLWRREWQNKNAMQIVDAGESLYNKCMLFLQSFDEIGKNLKLSQEKFVLIVFIMGLTTCRPYKIIVYSPHYYNILDTVFITDTIFITKDQPVTLETSPTVNYIPGRIELPEIKDNNWLIDHFSYSLEYDTAQRHALWVAFFNLHKNLVCYIS